MSRIFALLVTCCTNGDMSFDGPETFYVETVYYGPQMMFLEVFGNWHNRAHARPDCRYKNLSEKLFTL